MKVRIISEKNSRDLEKAVNEYLERAKRSGNKVIDIKFSGTGTWAPDGIEHWSAMIIME
ncbi:MAG: sporulation protein Cse60 [Bacteroidaceae bacterium]|nr:sporulation protein Cse60 [Bacteroidaceae bacterium]